MRHTTTIEGRADSNLWLAAAATALVLMFVLSGGAQGIDVEQVPATLPGQVQEVAQPMPRATFPTVDPSGEPSVDMVLRVWSALEHQRQGEWEEALDVWYTVNLAVDTDQWRHIAMAQAHLALGQYDEAAGALATAEEAAPNNAVMHYFRGLLRLEQVPHAYDWYDAQGTVRTRFVDYRPIDVVPNSRAMYRYVARVELQKAIEFANDVRLDQPLTPEYWQSTLAFGPTVGDLLLATGADNFAARAHNILGGLLLEEGALDEAEYHIDHAAKAGMFISYNYVDLISEYENRGYYLDAARVCAKAVGHGIEENAAHSRALSNVQQAIGW